MIKDGGWHLLTINWFSNKWYISTFSLFCQTQKLISDLETPDIYFLLLCYSAWYFSSFFLFPDNSTDDHKRGNSFSRNHLRWFLWPFFFCKTYCHSLGFWLLAAGIPCVMKGNVWVTWKLFTSSAMWTVLAISPRKIIWFQRQLTRSDVLSCPEGCWRGRMGVLEEMLTEWRTQTWCSRVKSWPCFKLKFDCCGYSMSQVFVFFIISFKLPAGAWL